MKCKLVILFFVVISSQAKSQDSESIYTIFSDKLSLTLLKTDTTYTNGKNGERFPTIAYLSNCPGYYDQDLFKIKVEGLRNSTNDLTTVSPWEIKKKTLYTVFAYTKQDKILARISILYLYEQDGFIMQYVDLSGANKKIKYKPK